MIITRRGNRFDLAVTPMVTPKSLTITCNGCEGAATKVVFPGKIHPLKPGKALTFDLREKQLQETPNEKNCNPRHEPGDRQELKG